ncbi:phosphoribosylamine--glycine ligase [Wenjunlia tyrosinilytica]|uniref:phosphoribosylamine--glycine ligase n=1 Tax=Wenjunlia tyrosinilytica TaxID=1544741 RepID=A0A917ZT48_9ACTN|nr:phosphoribosylamine--glycine ligase [Wenjunlia tyrosinilytica]GGO93668.1 phosphoribosylamine--glycine ligase [Wenjunlia tyrosinilytica]
MTSVLLVGGTGRGHALCDLFVRTDPDVTVYYGPGCDVIEHERIVPVPEVRLDDPATALEFLSRHQVEFVLVANIDALSIGYVDVLAARGHRVIGPTKAAAALESSKERSKVFLERHGLPTAAYEAFGDPDKAKAYIRGRTHPVVVKTDGLTPYGDGAVVCDTAADAEEAVDAFARAQGEDFHVVVEERLFGREISVFALLDGVNHLMFPCAEDYKRALDGDLGKNCDGMGSVAPHPLAGGDLRDRIRRELLEPLTRGVRDEELGFTGFVYIGAMITGDGLKVIEINARFGDSEAQAVLPSVRSNFSDLCRAVLKQDLDRCRLVTDDLVRCSVAVTQGPVDPSDPAAGPGWPFGEFETGLPISGLGTEAPERAQVFYAGMRKGPGGGPVTSGGRVLHVVGSGTTLEQARAHAYEQVARISFPGARSRSDIGARRASTGAPRTELPAPRTDIGRPDLGDALLQAAHSDHV